MRKRIKINPFEILVLASVFSFHAQADITSWRNAGNGEYLSDNPPANWNDNVLWKTSLSQQSNASPILVGERLYFCQEPATLVCVDKGSGDILWERENNLIDMLGLSEEEKARARLMQTQSREMVRELSRLRNDLRRLERAAEREPENETRKQAVERKRAEMEALRAERQKLTGDPKLGAIALVPTHRVNGYTSFTPVSDGRNVYASFGQGVLTAYDLEGNLQWRKRMEQPNPANGQYKWGGSTSPIIVDGKLIVRFADYVALDPNTGEEIWRIPSEVVYGTPAIFELEGQSFLFTPRGEVIRARDGRTVQSGLVSLHPRYPWSAFNSPVIEKGVVYTVRGLGSEPQDGIVHAFRIPKDLDTLMNVGFEEIWRAEVHPNRYYASPIVHEGLMYVISQDFVFTVLAADSGEIVYEHKIENLRGYAYPSISLAGDKLFFGSDEGVLIALQPGREYKELARSQFDVFRSTPIFSDDRAYLRTYSEIYAFKRK